MIERLKDLIAGVWPRLRLRTILFGVLLFAAAMPAIGAISLRVYENTLVRQTEAELVAQGAALAAVAAITWPGETMRARHTYGILRRMDLSDAVAADLDAYVALAVRLGTDRAALADLAARMALRRDALWRDSAPVADLSAFLERAAAGPT